MSPFLRKTFGLALGLAGVSCGANGTPTVAEAGAADASKSSSDGGGEAGTEAGGSTEASAEAGSHAESGASDGAVVCNSLVNAAPVVEQVNVATAPPTPAGGPMPSGTYYLTAAKVYTGADGGAGPTGITDQYTAVITGTSFEDVANVVGEGGSGTFGGTVTTSGSSIAITFTCGNSGTSGFTAFDSDGTTFTVYDNEGTQTAALTFTKASAVSTDGGESDAPSGG
jgi:hypothetical protein